MINVAICDDNAHDLTNLNSLLSQYRQKSSVPLNITTFSVAAELLDASEHGADFDVIFLDVLMPGLNGIQTARELRHLGICAELVYTTTSPDFALDAFSVRARDYLLKPVCPSALFSCMDELRLRMKDETKLVVRGRQGLRSLPPDYVEYGEAVRNTVLWNLRTGELIEGRDNFQKALDQLSPYPQFIQVHRSYLINMHYITRFDRKDKFIELESMKRIPVSKARFGQIEELYLAFKHREVCV